MGKTLHCRDVGFECDGVVRAGLVKAKEYLEKKYPEISIDLMYNLAGQRGRATIQTRYASLADHERIDAEANKDEAYSKLLEPIMSSSAHQVVDQFYRTIYPQ